MLYTLYSPSCRLPYIVIFHLAFYSASPFIFHSLLPSLLPFIPLALNSLYLPSSIFYSHLPFSTCFSLLSLLPYIFIPLSSFFYFPTCLFLRAFHSLLPSNYSLLPFIPLALNSLYLPSSILYSHLPFSTCLSFPRAFISLWYRIIIVRIFTGHERPGEARDEGSLQGRSLAGPGQDQETRLARGLWCECRRWGLFAIEYSVSCLTSNRD